MTTTAAQRRALGAYGETVAARTWPSRGWCCSTATGGATQGEIDLVLRDGDGAGRVRGQDPHQPDVCGTPHEAVDDAKLDAAAPAGCGAGARSTASGRARRGSTWSASSAPRRGPAHGRPRAGAGLMPFATAHTRLARTAPLGHLIDVQADVSPGQVATALVGRAGRRAQRGAGPLPDGDHQQRASTGRRPGGSRSCSRRPTCPSAAPTSTWRSRSPCSARLRRGPARSRSRTRVLIGELTLVRRPALGARGAADGAGGRASAASRRVFVPEPQAGEAAMVPGMRCSGMRSLGQVVAELRGERGARGAAGRARCRAAGCSSWRGRGAARRGRPRRPARAWPTPATPSRWPPPAVTTCC